mgnify:CR=1 FL=1
MKVELTKAAREQERTITPGCNYDEVMRPQHYDFFPGVEVIDVIKRQLSRDEFAGFLKGNILKYRLRAGKKRDAMQDIRKADWYETELRNLEQES